MANLDTFTKSCAVVVMPSNKCFDNLEEDKYIHKLLQKCSNFNTLGFIWYAIVHNMDNTYPHLHIVIECEKRHRLQWYLNRVSEMLDVNTTQVQVQCVDSRIRSIQYLIHKNDKDKYQYDLSDLIYNCSDNDIVNIFNVDCKTTELSFAYLDMLFEDNNFNKVLIMREIGFGRYNQFRNTINEYYQLMLPIYRKKLLYEGACETLGIEE